ncbi:hypothetical protein [Pseudooceanicola aestuarii]|uniref:NAD(P)H-dependent amine dehydrogenase family protein n=1 Tax=Pseudooceanicola aestuarii TaxID=2697319 RepID=UPI0013D3C9B5|nr:hypothetical protein [Pseudooceanicola aestuarii]
MRKPRIIQWGTGSMGRTTIRRILDRDDVELVGAYVTNPDKVGRDVGEIVKRPATGIIATNDIDQILALDADVVLHTSQISVPYAGQNADVIRLLESGKNVISPNGYNRPDYHGPDYAEPLRNAAIKGGATLAGIGLNPGFIVERIALSLAGLVGGRTDMRVYEVVDASNAPSPGLVFNAMGFGSDPAVSDLRQGPVAELYDTYFAEIFDYVAEKLGTRITEITPLHELTLAPHDIAIRVGTIAKGTVAATTWKWRAGFADGSGMLLSILWTSSHELHGEDAAAHWVIEIDGRPGVRATVELLDENPEAPPAKPAMDAMAVLLLNAVPHVMAAGPGFWDLPAILPARREVAP